MSGSPQFDEDAFALPPEETKHRYYFDIHDGALFTRDEIGLELDGTEAIRREAIRAMVHIVNGASLDADQRSLVVAVRDNEDRALLMASLTLIVQEVGKGTPHPPHSN